MRPTMTVIIYIPNCLATTSKSAMEMIFPQMRQAIPRGEYLKIDMGYVCTQDYFYTCVKAGILLIFSIYKYVVY